MRLDENTTVLFDSDNFSPYEEEMKDAYFECFDVDIDEEEFSEDDPDFINFTNEEHEAVLSDELANLGQMVRDLKHDLKLPENSPNLMVAGTSGAWDERVGSTPNFYAHRSGGTLTPLFQDPAEVLVDMSRDIWSWRIKDVDGDLVIEGSHHDGVATRTVRALDPEQTQELLDWFEDDTSKVQPSQIWEQARKIEPEARYQGDSFER